MNRFGLYIKCITLALCFIALPEMALAQNVPTLTCVNGLPDGDIFVGLSCDAFGYTEPFSGLNCYFQYILNEVVKRMYCGMQYELAQFLKIMILLFVVIYGLMFTLGLAALTAKELTERLIKMALVWAFATNASWGVGLALYFFFGGIEEAVTWVVAVFFGNMDGRGFIAHIDYLLFQQLTGSLTTYGIYVLGFFTTLMVLMFPVFLLFLVYMMTVMAVLTRTVISYLLGLSIIAFLISLGPIFISMALFKSTYTFFDSWLKYLVSFALQIILIFAAVALWLYVMSLVPDFFGALFRMIVPYENLTHSNSSFAFFQNSWAVCYNGSPNVAANGTPIPTQTLVWSPPGCDPNAFSGDHACISATTVDVYNCRTSAPLTPYCQFSGDPACGVQDPASPSAFASNQRFIGWVSINLISLGILVYAFDALLRMMPNLARQLAGPVAAPQLGGGYGFGAVSMPGISGVGQIQSQLMYQAKSGIFEKFSAVRSSVNSTLAGSKKTPAQKARDNALGNKR